MSERKDFSPGNHSGQHPGKHTGNHTDKRIPHSQPGDAAPREQESIENQILQAFQDKESNGLPEDKYFRKIWNSIEIKAPVGEKYYLRTFFMIFLFLVFFVIFVLFYTDFLSSVVTLKDIHKENAGYFSTSPSLVTTPFDSRTLEKEIQMAGIVTVIAREESKIYLKSQDDQGVVLDFLQGHAILRKTADKRRLIIRLPEVVLHMNESGSLCNIYCYDGIVRIIPLINDAKVETGGKTYNVERTTIFFMLHGQPMMMRKDKTEILK